MAPIYYRIPNLNKSIAHKTRNSLPAIDAVYTNVFGSKQRQSPNVAGLMYDNILDLIEYKYASHLANDTVHDSADTTNVLNMVDVDVDVFAYVMGEYAKNVPVTNSMDLSPFNERQIERNDAWCDADNFIAQLFNYTNTLLEIKQRANAHFAEGAPIHNAADIVSISGTITIPTPDGIVPSLEYSDGVSKYIVELERSEPAFVKAKVGTWLLSIATLAKEVVDVFNTHIMEIATVHNSVDSDNISNPINL